MSSEGWKKYKLGELREITSSKRIYYSEYKSEGIPFFRSKEIIERHNGEKVSTKLYLSTQRYEEIKKKFGVPVRGDLLLTSVGTLGIPFLIESDEEFYFKDGNLTWFKDNGSNLLLSKYLYYWFLSPTGKQELERRKIGTTQEALTIEALKKVEIEIPPISSQYNVVEVLTAIDDKIKLNRQTNATLEAIAQAIFKEWFVDFNYPGATGEMVDSELGPIPKGWKVKPLDEIAEFLNGLALQKYPPENETEYLPVIKIRELRNGVTESSDRASRKLPKEYIVEDGDLLFSWSGSLEVMFWVGGEGALNQHLFKVTSKAYPLWFCYHWILHHLTDFRNIAEEKTTTMGHIKREHLTNALCFVPDNLGTGEGTLSLISEKMILLSEETNTLIKLRDSLLPKLLSPMSEEKL